MDRLTRAATVPVERVFILSVKSTQSPDVGTHTLLENVLWTRSETSTCALPGGTAIVPMAQPLAHVAIYLLEPESDDGFARWGLLGTDLAPGSELPVGRIPSRVELTTQRLPDARRS